MSLYIFSKSFPEYQERMAVMACVAALHMLDPALTLVPTEKEQWRRVLNPKKENCNDRTGLVGQRVGMHA